MYSHNGHGIVARLCKTYNGGNATNFISTGPVLLRPRYPVPFSGPVRPMRTSPDDGTRRNDSPGTGCNNSVVDPALCLHYLHAVKAGRPWLTGGLSWPVMESTRARARGTRAHFGSSVRVFPPHRSRVSSFSFAFFFAHPSPLYLLLSEFFNSSEFSKF